MSEAGSSRLLLEAIWEDRLPEAGDPGGAATCRNIGVVAGAEVDTAVDYLGEHGITAMPVDDPTSPRQRHAAAVRVGSADDGLRAAHILGELGYRTWDPIDGAAKSLHRRFRSNLTVAQTTDVTMVIDLQWDRPGGLAGRLPAALVPNENDFDLVDLPASLWPVYLLLRPLRLVVERLGLRRGGSHQLGPFLGTPTSLIGPLLDAAQVTSEDVLVDLGCGDGRVVVGAASTIGCRAIGVENNPTLAQQARRRAADAGSAGELVSIVEADASNVADLAPEGTVFFVFVPADAAVNLVSDLLASAEPGTRIVVHEQHRLRNEPPGAVTSAVLSDNAVTVAHCWTVS